MQGRKKLYTSDDQLKEAKKLYNKKYYDKVCSERKSGNTIKKDYTDDELKQIVNIVGLKRILLI